MSSLRRASWVVVALSMGALGCDRGPESDGGVEIDAGDPRGDGGADAGGEPADAGTDAAVEAGTDGGGEIDAGSDAGPPDASADAGGIDPSSIPAPRPIEPASTAFTTSPTVRFRWALTPPATGARIEICRDRACTDVRETLDADGETATTLVPPDPGATSRVFYFRLTGRADGVLGTAQSPVWSFSVQGRVAVTTSGTWGTTHDFDGDGLSDILGGSSAASAVRLYRGRSPAGAAPAPDTTFSAAPAIGVGTAVFGAGDVDGDGIADLAIGTASDLLVYHGALGGFGPSMTVASAATTVAGVSPSRSTAAAAGDVDRDGYADIVVADPSMGRIMLYRGGASGLDTTGAPLARAETGFAASVAGACDVNGDGYSDVIVGAADAALVFFGGATGLDPTAAQELVPGVGSAGFGASVACAGDVNGDGYADVIVGAPASNAAFVFHGGGSGAATGSLRKIPGAPAAGTTWHASGFGSWVASAGDVNADGFSDVVVVAPDPAPPDGSSHFVGSAFVFHGRAGGFPATDPSTSTAHSNVVGASPVENRAQVSQYAGDMDGDGYGDLVTGAPTWSGGGAVLLGRGSATGVPVAVAWLLGGGGPDFGGAIATLWARWVASRG